MPTLNGFPYGRTADEARQVAQIKTFRVPGTDVLVPLRADTAPLLLGFLAEFHQLVEPLRASATWGFAWRLVRGALTISFHAPGIAVDADADEHPLGKRGTFSPTQATTIRRLCKKYGLRWGGDYKNRADEMHAEIILPYDQALELVRRLQTHPAAPEAGGPPWFRRVLLPGARGDDVIAVQHRLSAAPTGVMDEHTREVLTRWQAVHGVPANGVVGLATAKALGA